MKKPDVSRYVYDVAGRKVVTSQPMSESEIELYLKGDPDDKMKYCLGMKENGMPAGKVDQIAWLLLQMDGCGFCKVCRDEPCNIKDGEKCTTNIADYIRRIVREENGRTYHGRKCQLSCKD